MIDGRKQVAGQGRGQRTQVRHKALVAGVQAQMECQRFPAVERAATLAARELRLARVFGRALAGGGDRRDDVTVRHVLHLLLALVVLDLLHLDVLLLVLLLALGLGLLLGLLLRLLLRVRRHDGVGRDDGGVGRVRIDTAVRVAVVCVQLRLGAETLAARNAREWLVAGVDSERAMKKRANESILDDFCLK